MMELTTLNRLKLIRYEEYIESMDIYELKEEYSSILKKASQAMREYGIVKRSIISEEGMKFLQQRAELTKLMSDRTAHRLASKFVG